MSQHTQLQAADGHKLDAYIAQPTGEPKAGIVVLQEIFGVNAHIRSVADGFARAGYLTIAPALFDRAQRDVELPYDPEGGKQGMQIVQRIPIDQTLADIAAAIQYLREHGARKVGVVGYCWGGTLAWVSNTRLHPDATVSYYPGGIQNYIHEKSTCPAIFHFGLEDNHIPQSVVEQVRHEYPGFSVFTYPGAGHAFNRDIGASYNPAAAKLALQRTLAHFDEYLVAAR
ncbi:MAG TPA: dienelactone hydrolase family protein [Acidobacteriaceae bacterium]|nr:dienelactone hydrolase family protein [Terriglobia bacterium]HVC91470.1 dienelactone hydrolase family protein [Acidobacteriaceae bacterium]